MEYEFWLAGQMRISARKRIQAKTLAGSARRLFAMDEKELSKLHIFSEKEIRILTDGRDPSRVAGQWEQFLKSGIKFVPYGDSAFPARLLHIHQPPCALYGKGSLPDTEKNIAVVGARSCSEYGRSIAGKLAAKIAAGGAGVISGLAAGIDSAAHAGALSVSGKTYAVLGCGCDICYPAASVNLYRNILENGGGILSEYPPGTKPMPYRFPERNRIISGLSDIVVVAEARERSGSLITADFALEQGKDVYAVPGRFGDALSRGCNRLISQGAGILYDIEEFLETAGITDGEERKPELDVQIPLEKEEILVYSCLDLHPKFINAIIDEAGMELLGVLRVLGTLKKRGLVQETFPNYFSRCL